MDPHELKSRLRGVFCLTATPFQEDMSLDMEGLRQNVAWLKEQGLSALGAACGEGEFFSLTMDEFMEVAETVVDEVDGALPVIVGVGHGVMMAREFAIAAQEMGADAILLMPPYLVTPEPEGLARYVARIAQSVDTGIILCHQNNAHYSEQSIEKLLQFENIIGFMDGSGDLDHFNMLRRHFGDHLAWFNGTPTAEMTAPAYFAAGAAGHASAIANFLPSVAIEFCQACRENRMDRVWEITDELVKPVCEIRDRRIGYNISLVKAGLELVGRAGGHVRPPLVELDPQSRSDLRRILSFWTDLPT